MEVKLLVGLLMLTLTLGDSIYQLQINPTTETIREVSEYRVSLRNPNTIPANGKIKVLFPEEFSASNLKNSVCQNFYNIDPGASCLVQENEIVLVDGFPEEVSADTSISFTIASVENPMYAKQSGSFQVFITSQEDSVIDSSTSGNFLDLEPAQLGQVTIGSSSNVSGEDATWTFALNLSYSVPAGGQIEVYFPPWDINLGVSYHKSFIRETPTCQPFSCIFESDLLTLTISEEVSARVEFQVSTVKNPPNTQRISNFEVRTKAQEGYIESSVGTEVSIKVSEPGQFLSSSHEFESGKTKVNLEEVYKFSVSNSNPIPADGYIEVKFPKEVGLEGYVSSVIGIFGIDQNPVSIEISNSVLKILSPFRSYKDPGTYIEFKIDSCKNPPTTQPTSSFEIYLKTGEGYLIDEVTQGLQISSTEGTLSVSVYPENYQISKETTYTFSFRSNEPILEGSAIEVVPPPTVKFTETPQSTCTGVLQGIVDSSLCQVQNQKLLITNGFPSDFGTSRIEFYLEKVTNPFSIEETEDFQISVYTSDTFEYLISKGSGGRFTAEPGNFESVDIESSSYITGDPATYTFRIQTANVIPQGGKIFIELPTEIFIQNTLAVCGDWQGFENSATCKSTQNSITVENGFASQKFNPGLLVFSIPGIKNPTSTKPSSSFRVESQNQAGNTVEVNDSDLVITMINPHELLDAELTSSSYQVYSQTDLTFTIQPFNPFPSGGYLFIEPPEGMSFSSQNFCQATGSVTESASCVLIGNQLRATITFPQPRTTNQFSFRVARVVNPTSTKPTESFKLELRESEYKIDFKDTGLVLEMTTPADMDWASVDLEEKGINKVTSYSFDFRTSVSTPKDSYLEVTFPENVSIDSFANCQVDGTSFACSKVSQSIVRVNMFTQESPPNNFRLQIDSIKNSPQAQYESFTLTTKTSEGYLIEKESLEVNFECYSPCETCQNSPDNCLSCIENSPTPYFWGNQCFEECPQGTFDPGNKECTSCDSKCKTCLGLETCTSCILNSDYPYLHQSSCISNCPSNTFVNQDFECVACSESCKTCQEAPGNCSSCVYPQVLYKGNCISECPGSTYITSEECFDCSEICGECKDSPENCSSCEPQKIFFENSCYQECPEDETLPVENTCERCTFPCKTCSQSLTNCTSCEYDYYLSGNTCNAICNPGFYKTETSCEECSSECLECRGSATYCTKCPEEYLKYKGRCLESCPPEVSVESQGECIECIDSCLTCKGSADYCTSCYSGTYLFENQCLNQCPSGKLPSSGKCVSCDPACASCSGTQGNCTECSPSYYRHEDQCLKTCPSGFAGVSGECRPCDSSCLTCDQEVTSCSSCPSGSYLFGSKCVTNCPASYIAQEGVCLDPQTQECAQACTLEKLSNSVCDPECNNEACNFDNQVCSEPSEEDYEQFNSEIVERTENLALEKEPFVMSGLALVSIALIGAGSAFMGTAFVSSAVGVLGLLQTGGFIGLVVEVSSADSTKGRVLLEVEETEVELIFYSLVFLLVLHFAANLVFFWVYWKRIKAGDPIHKDWTEIHKYFSCFVTTVSLLVSFKAIRFFYCKLLKKEATVFERWSRLLSPLIRTTYIYLLVVTLPLISIQVFTLTVFSTGNLVFILTLDCLVLNSAEGIFSVVDIYRMGKTIAKEEDANPVGLVGTFVPTQYEDNCTNTDFFKESPLEKTGIIQNYFKNLKKLRKSRAEPKLNKTQSMKEFKDAKASHNRASSDPSVYKKYVERRLENPNFSFTESSSFKSSRAAIQAEEEPEILKCPDRRLSESVVILNNGHVSPVVLEEIDEAYISSSEFSKYPSQESMAELSASAIQRQEESFFLGKENQEFSSQQKSIHSSVENELLDSVMDDSQDFTGSVWKFGKGTFEKSQKVKKKPAKTQNAWTPNKDILSKVYKQNFFQKQDRKPPAKKPPTKKMLPQQNFNLSFEAIYMQRLGSSRQSNTIKRPNTTKASSRVNSPKLV